MLYDDLEGWNWGEMWEEVLIRREYRYAYG